MSFLFVPGWPGFLLEMAVGGLLANAGTGLLITGALGVTVVLGFAAAYWLAGVPEPAHGQPSPVQRAGTAVRRARDRAATGWERRPVLPADDTATIAWLGELHHDQPPSWALPAPTAPLALPAPPVTFVSSPPVLPASSPAGTDDGPAPVGAVTPDVPSPAMPDGTPGSGPAAGLGTTDSGVEGARGPADGRAVAVTGEGWQRAAELPGTNDPSGSLTTPDPAPRALTADEETCPGRPADSHCDHWWDGQPCCACGSSTPAPDVPGRAPAPAHTPGPPPSPAREGSGAGPAGDPRWPWLDRAWADDTGTFEALCREGT